MNDLGQRSSRRLAACLVGAFALACTTVAPPVAELPAEPVRGFSHTDFDTFLGRHVEAGRVDYEAARHDRADLDRYLARIAAISPDSHPDRFPTEQDALAYWINAYNASAIALVLASYPIESVADVKAPFPLRFVLPRVAGFFVFRRVELGGDTISLYALENDVVRARFPDPRAHFALNCASLGCPRLPAEAFTGAELESQLERETRLFLGEPRNVRLDPEARTLTLSSILDWYEGDFTGWLEERHPEREASLRSYVLLYVSEEQAAAIRRCADCRVEFVPYDWGLNDRARPAEMQVAGRPEP